MRRGDLSDPYMLPNYLVKYFISKGYAGYVNPETPYIKDNKPTGNARFGEVVFGYNVLDHLDRDYNNPNDWQYSSISLATPTLKLLIEDMEDYKTTNIDFHAGDLLEHSIWVMFYADKIYQHDKQHQNCSYCKWGSGIPRSEHMRKFIATAAFLHDIGKAGDLKHLYYDKPDHPHTGADYLSGKAQYRLGGSNKGKVLNIDDLIRELDLPQGPYRQILTCLVDNHWKFGGYMKTLDEQSPKKAAKQYIEDVMDSLTRYGLQSIINSKKELSIYFRIQMLISAADLLGTKPYNDHKKIRVVSDYIKEQTKGLTSGTKEFAEKSSEVPKVNINDHSDLLKGISNRSQVHRGSDKYKEFKYDTVGIEFRKIILDLIK
jgi:hypothetical protein